ncbi:hypothetical protein TNIN_227891 [Trichonephila inaurata madagascariensis]|uniref:Uncharacterized protein n=1 Tax=Trichonephila inaurata madagascariensis TaxID=2747483 RepID=A0A8X6YW72_9ARAC|nr:hypothetical protein TNIN_227891 [Trichonephila inaurata madagascariensis]
MALSNRKMSDFYCFVEWKEKGKGSARPPCCTPSGIHFPFDDRVKHFALALPKKTYLLLERGEEEVDWTELCIKKIILSGFASDYTGASLKVVEDII